MPPLSVDDFKFHTVPFAKQLEGFRLSAPAPFFAYTMEQRTGKTKLTLDVATFNFFDGVIDALLVIAPNGVHRDWVTEAIPEHLDPATNFRAFFWGEMNPGTKKFDAAWRELLDHRGLLIVTVNVEAIANESCKKYLRPLLKERRVFTAVDESSIIKSPDANRTTAALAIGQRSVVRRILDGTPDAESPLELFTQYRFLHRSILGFDDYYAFRHRYAVMEKISVPMMVRDRITGALVESKKNIQKVKTYQRLEELQAKIAPFTYRVLRADCYDLPPKVYSKRRYQPSSLQIDVYEQLRETFRAEVRAGLEINGTNVLARYIRYQQVLSNFVPSAPFVLCDACGGQGCPRCDDQGVIESTEPPKTLDENHHPRLEALAAELSSDRPLPTIIWACYDQEIDEIMRLCRDLGRRPVRYDGRVSPDEKAANKAAFKAGDASDFVGKASSGGRGLTLPNAEKIIYYNNAFALRLRLQSEDRAEAVGNARSTGIVDIVASPWSASPTIDDIKVTALRSKQSLSAMVNNDPQRNWI